MRTRWAIVAIARSEEERSMEAQAAILERDGRVATITINRPEAMNALNSAVRRGLAEAFAAFRDDPDLWVAILTGVGERAFRRVDEITLWNDLAYASEGA
jgi:enoyl-CoA hydratase/carnithine racemase